MTFMMHIPIILYACLLWFFSILLEEVITTLCIHKVGRLDQLNWNNKPSFLLRGKQNM